MAFFCDERKTENLWKKEHIELHAEIKVFFSQNIYTVTMFFLVNWNGCDWWRHWMKKKCWQKRRNCRNIKLSCSRDTIE